jgi:hypothetical protein
MRKMYTFTRRWVDIHKLCYILYLEFCLDSYCCLLKEAALSFTSVIYDATLLLFVLFWYYLFYLYTFIYSMFCGKVLQEFISVQILVSNYMYYMQFWTPVAVFLSPEYICIMYSHKCIFPLIKSLCSLVKYGEYRARKIEYSLWVCAKAGCNSLCYMPFHKVE